MSARWYVIVCILALVAGKADAQTREFRFRGFADGGSTTFTAQKSFKAILGSERGIVYGGGVEAVLPQLVFISVRASRFQKTGERVFVFQDKEYRLGIPEKISITPVEVTGGYRFDFGSWLVPYAGGGVGWHRFEDTSDFADASENFKKTYPGFQLVGGAEFRVAGWVGVGAEAQWSRVPKALGEDDNGVAKTYNETDLGGTTFRVKLVIGR